MKTTTLLLLCIMATTKLFAIHKVDVTDKYIINANCATLSGWDYWGHDIPEHLDGTWATWHTFGGTFNSFNPPFIERWVYSGTQLENGILSQVIKGLPPGRYSIEADVIACQQLNPTGYETGTYLFAESGTCRDSINTITANGVPKHYAIEIDVNNGILTIGFETVNSEMNWIAIDNWKLYQLSRKGDVNEDGEVDISDMVAVINIIANRSAYNKNVLSDLAVKVRLCPNSNHPHVIDLGLGVKFACCNVDASSPEEFGGYYAWGETEERKIYSSSNYLMSSLNGTHDLSSEEDVATKKLGKPYRMPTFDECEELIKKCKWVWSELNNVIGAYVTGPNGHAIFLPAASFTEENGGPAIGTYGSYWGSTHVTNPNFATEIVFGTAYYRNDFQIGDFFYEMGPLATRYTGRSVRPVAEYMPGDVNLDGEVDISDIVAIINIISVGSTSKTEEWSDLDVMGKLCPDSNHPHVVDLGLGVKFACCNVGASSPEEFGGYYAWGETQEKSFYSSTNYLMESLSGTYDLSPDEDVAAIKLGEPYRMPTFEELEELIKKCKWTWREFNNVVGAFVTGPSGKTIFLPAASYMDEKGRPAFGTYGSYWGSTHVSNPDYAAEIVFGTAYYRNEFKIGDFFYEMGPYATRYTGRSVRPVSD